MAHKAFTITEASDHERGVVVDRDKGIIRDVKILGLVSENNRRYLPEAVKSAKHLYEGIKVNINHPDSSNDQRSAEDRFGKLINVYFVEGEGLYGDLMFLKSHPMAERVCEAAERMTDVFGLSHNAQGDGVDDKDGCFVINEIVSVRHVDLVSDPATTKSLSEAVNMEKKSIKEESRDPAMKDIENIDSFLSKANASIKSLLNNGIGDKTESSVKAIQTIIDKAKASLRAVRNSNLSEAIKTKESDMPYDKEMPEEEKDIKPVNERKDDMEGAIRAAFSSIDDMAGLIPQLANDLRAIVKVNPKADRFLAPAFSSMQSIRSLCDKVKQTVQKIYDTLESDSSDMEGDDTLDEKPVKEEIDSSDVDDAFMIAANLSNHSLKLISLLKGMKSEDASLFSRYIADGDVKATRAYTDLKALADKLKKLASQLESKDGMEADEVDIFDEEPSEEVEPDMEEEELDKKVPMESKRIVKLCHANGIKPTKGLLEDFKGLSLASIKRHIGRLKLARQSRAPRSSAPASSEISESKIPTDVFSWLRS